MNDIDKSFIYRFLFSKILKIMKTLKLTVINKQLRGFKTLVKKEDAATQLLRYLL
jgi:hypothetical protein